jgi:hypothetical protein
MSDLKTPILKKKETQIEFNRIPGKENQGD